MNALKRLYARLYSAELTAAAWIDTRPVGRMFMLAWYHQGLRPWVPAAMTVPAMVIGHLGHITFIVAAGITVAATLFARIAAKSHFILNEEDRPCPYCPAGDDRGGTGGVWLDWDGLPPAPAPMPDYDDERIRNWAGDADQWLAELTADTRRATEGGAL